MAAVTPGSAAPVSAAERQARPSATAFSAVDLSVKAPLVRISAMQLTHTKSLLFPEEYAVAQYTSLCRDVVADMG